MATSPHTASASVSIRLNVTGEADTKKAIDRVKGRIDALDSRTKGLDNRLDNISASADRNAESMDKHSEAMDRYTAKFVDFDEAIRAHRDNQRDMRRDWGENNAKLREMGESARLASADFDALSRSVNSLHKTHLKPFDNELRQKKKDFADLRKEMHESDRQWRSTRNEVNQTRRSVRSFGDGDDGLFAKMFKPGIKFLKLFGIEFLAASAVIAVFKGSLWLGEVAMKGWQAALTGVGMAAGVAVAGLSAFIAAQRELQVAKLAPFFKANGTNATGASSMLALTSGIMGDRSLQMFDQKTLTGIAGEAAKTGDASNGGFRSLVRDLGDFAIVAADPNKALSQLVKNFSAANKAGSISAEMYAEIAEASPELAKGFEEMYGDTKKLEKALAAGEVTSSGFFAALESGRLKSLEPFKGALDGVNDTLMGTFKGSLAAVKEQLTEIGMPLVDTLKRPLLVLEREIRVLLMKIAPMIQRTFGQMFEGMGGRGGGLQRFMDRLATLINTSLPKMLSMGGKIRDWARTVGKWFGKLGDYLRRMTVAWDELYEKILRPIGVEIGKTFNHFIASFGRTLEKSGGFADSFAARIETIGEGVRKLIDGFMHMRIALAPVMDTFSRLLQILSKILDVSGGLGQTFLALFLTGKFMGRRGRRGEGGGGGGGGLLSTMMMPFMFPFGAAGTGMSTEGVRNGWGQARTQYAMARSSNYRGTGYNGADVPIMTRRQALRESSRVFFASGGRDFFRQGAKTFTKAALPVAASIVGGLISGKSKQTDTGKQALSGALSGAGMGAMIGSMIGPAGTAIGAVVGGIGGGLTGFLGAKKEQKREREAAIESIRETAYEGYVVNDIENLQSILDRSRARLELLGGKNTYEADVKYSSFGINGGDMAPRIDRLLGGLQVFANDLSNPESQRRLIAQILSPSGQASTADFSEFEFLGGKINVDKTAFAGGMEAQIDTLNKLISSGALKNVYGYGAGETVAALDDASRTVERLKKTLMLQENFPELKDLSSSQIYDKYTEILDEQDLKMRRLTQNVSAMSEVMGITGREAQKLATDLNMDLSASFLSMSDIVRALGYSTDEYANKATAAGRILRDALSPIEERRAERDLNARWNAAGLELTDGSYANKADAMVAAEDYAAVNIERLLQEYINTEGMSYSDFVTRTEGSFGRLLGGMKDTFGADDSRYQALLQVVNEVMEPMRKNDFSTRMKYDSQFALDTEAFLAEKVRKLIADGGTYEGSGTAVAEEFKKYLTENGVAELSGSALETIVKSEFVAQADAIGANIDKLILALTEAMDTISVNLDGRIAITLTENGKQISQMATGFNTRSGSTGTNRPNTGGNDLGGDTATTRLGRTLSKHIAFNSMVAGSRTVTSSLRTNNLGSMNSDHVTGNAYDLIGDNLGQYSSLINNAGGFAEFHGSAGSRHLHVVPPQGDTANPVTTTSGSSDSVIINAPITINATDGETARQIAMIAIQEIERLQRTAKERR